jgi:hypothetical protein
VRDLLADDKTAKHHLKVREHPKNGSYVEGQLQTYKKHCNTNKKVI